MSKKLWMPYIKPTRKVHSSGYRCFEVGYLTETEKIVLGTTSDFISIKELLKNSPLRINLDLTREGYIRFYGNSNGLRWDNENDDQWVGSSVYLVSGRFFPFGKPAAYNNSLAFSGLYS